MKEITLEELFEQANSINLRSQSTDIEPPYVRNKIAKMADRIAHIADTASNVEILTDYDADGICSAYIMQKLLLGINPDMDVHVTCNDRRGAYGIPDFVTPQENTKYIVMDMGSNEVRDIRKTFGKDTIIIDHHLIESELNRLLFEMENTLLNPHGMSEDDELNADYCATGLAFRIFLELENNYLSLQNDVLQNTLKAMACIGSITDVVNVADEHSQNRWIIQQGMDCIKKANPKNIDNTLLYVLKKCGVVSKHTTAKDIAFHVGSFLNSASRMSSVMNDNGAMRMYEALIGEDTEKLDELFAWNETKKSMTKELQDERYQIFLQRERFLDTPVSVYVLDNVPATFCGILAGKIAEATDKASICLSYHPYSKSFSGSGRNPDKQSSLKDWMDMVAQSAEEQGFTIQYGGHSNAIGISSLTNLTAFMKAVNAHAKELVRLQQEPTVLKISSEELKDKDTVALLESLEPMGRGFELPPVLIEGTVSSSRTLSNQASWCAFEITTKGGASIKINDWSFSPEKYPLNSQQQVKFLASLGISSYRGVHLECSAMWNREIFKEQQQDLQKMFSNDVQKGL